MMGASNRAQNNASTPSTNQQLPSLAGAVKQEVHRKLRYQIK
jgi:hypothetical protein